MASSKILGGEWESLLQILSRSVDLEETLRQSGALKRRREIRDAPTLLRLALVYSACGKSLRRTAAWADLQDLAHLSDVALMKRLRKAAGWLRQLLMAKLAERLPVAPTKPLGYRLRVVDATTASIPGSKGTDYRIHLGFDLRTLEIDRIDVTGPEGGESFGRLAINPGDLILADRGYAHRRGLAEVHRSGADFLIRINWQNLPLQDLQGRRLDLPQWLEQIQSSREAELEVLTVAQDSQGIPSLPVRLIAIRREAGAVEAEQQRIRQRARNGREADARTLKAAEFFLLLTSVPRERVSAQRALELYRLRWQIEMTFKRLKGLLHLGSVPAKDRDLAQCYLYGKLLTALMLEDLTKDHLAFSPSEPEALCKHLESSGNPLQGNVPCLPGIPEPF